MTTTPIDTRNDEIFRLCTEEDVSLSELASRFQMTTAAICKILRVARARRPDAPPGRGSPPGQRRFGEPVSRRHRAIGRRIKWWREQKLRVGVREAAIYLGLSTYRLQAIEEGCYADVGLALLQRLAGRMGIETDELLSKTAARPPHEWTRFEG